MTQPAEHFGREYLLVLGETYGIRGWTIRGEKLCAAGSSYFWGPGVNVAQHSEAYPACWSPYFVTMHSFGGYPMGWEFHSWNLHKKPKPHTEAPVEGCTCGFYAYNSPDGLTLGSVKGIVRITGRTLIGTKGYRFEKGEIVCLLDPTAGPDQDTVPWRRDALRVIRKNYPDIPIASSEDEMLKLFPLNTGETE